ncbi:YopT-type cysteine protease domain-containing protein [Pseudomonas sp. NPDC086251]|uniref:YopT-type cysteine protease domain-containing protein n=1 Tax=Pseudomonas sp. NPDC086251 TaxID=3364431 RepID=UPI003839950A
MSSYLDSDYFALTPKEAQGRIQDELKLHLNHVDTLNLKPDDLCSQGLADAMSMVANDDEVGFNMCCLYKSSGPAHGIACIKKQDCIKFMDPNFGEVSFNFSTEF